MLDVYKRQIKIRAKNACKTGNFGADVSVWAFLQQTWDREGAGWTKTLAAGCMGSGDIAPTGRDVRRMFAILV